MAANYSTLLSKNPQHSRSQRQSLFRPGLLSMLIVILIPILLAACTSAQSSEPISIVQAAYDRRNDGDVDGCMEFYSDDAVVFSVWGRFADAQDFREYLEQKWVPKHFRNEVSDLRADGNEVTYTSKLYLGDELLGTMDNCLTVLADGKIIFDGTERYRNQECFIDPTHAFCPGH